MRLALAHALALVAVVCTALATAAIAAPTDAPRLAIGPSVVKATNGKLVLTAKCIGTERCQSVLTARIDVRNGELGGQIFKVEAGSSTKLVFKLRPEVRTWLKTHRRSRLVVEARTSNEDYEVVWRGTFRLTLLA